jgi:hypothetical protein
MSDSRNPQRDRGSVLPLALVMAVVMAVVIAAVASYVTTGLKYGRVVEDRADRLAAADGGLRYAIERLQNSAYAGCLSNLGNTGYTIEFPAKVNGADVEVTCRKGTSGIGDIKAWAIIVTGEGVPSGQWMLKSQAGGGTQKLLGGPVWVSDPGRTDLKAPVTVEDGDVWYYRADCDNPNLTIDSNLSFKPNYRGPICVPQPWDEVFTGPTPGGIPPVTDVANTNPAPTVDANGCTVFRPGRYTVAPALGSNTYFQSGNYYFQNFTLDITGSVVTAGWADNVRYGDKQYIPNFACSDPNNPTSAVNVDKASGSEPGATFYLGGSARIEIGNHGSLEILRRLQGDDLVSIHAFCDPNAPAPEGVWCDDPPVGADHTASTLSYNDNVIVTKSGNNSDLAIHGLLWAPRAQLEFGNVTNAANGQLLGGAAVSRIVLQASASAQAFVIRVETSPIDFELRVDATATKDGLSTTMTAVVQVDDQGTTAVNSLRVVDP